MPARSPQAPQPKWSAILEVQDPDGTRTRHPFVHPRMSVGRRRDNDLSLADEGVSQQHCELASEQGFFVVRDLASQNGTWLNGSRIREARLRDGDEIRIGGTRIAVSLQGEVRRPVRLRLAGVALGLLVLGLLVWRMAARETDLRAAYVAALQQALEVDPCAAPDASAIDAQLAGRSVAIALDKGEVHLSQEDAKTDTELLGLYRQKADALARMPDPQPLRDANERAARLGQRLWSAKDRRQAAYAESLLRDREKAADALAQGVAQLRDETQRLADLIDAVVARKEAPRAAALAHFRFTSALPQLTAACRAEEARTSAGAQAALNALAE